jgi:hypothetical protein
MANIILYRSSHLFLLPIIYYFFSEKSIIKTNILLCIFINFILSIRFWSNPTKGSLMNKIDKIAALSSIIIVTTFVVFISPNILYLIKYFIVLFCMKISFYLSGIFSNKKWCSKEHSIAHSFVHLFGTIGIFFIFY